MRIFTKKAFRFINTETGKVVKTAPLSFHDVPEWVAQDPIYHWAVRDGDVELIQTKAAEAAVEKDGKKK